MKITLAFLTLGICLAFTNVSAFPRKKMSQSEAYSHSRMISMVIKRFNDWKNCHRCSDIELYCLERAIVGDLSFILKLLVNDMGCTLRDFLKQSHFQYIQVAYIYNAVEHDDNEPLVKLLRPNQMLDVYVQTICSLVNTPLTDSNVNMGNDLNMVNQVMGGVMDTAFDVVGGVISIPGHIISGVTDLAGGVVKGVVDTAGGVVKGVVDTAGGVVKGLTNAAGGAVKGVTDAASGVVKGVLGGLGGIFGGKKG